jgi:cell division protein FtsB
MKIKNDYTKVVYDFFTRLNDVRFVGQIIFVIIVLLISWSGVKSIQANYGLQKQITALKEQNNLQKLQDENLQLQNNYYKTNQYLELSAREDFGLAAKGETELIVPQNVALAHTQNISIPGSQQSTVEISSKQSNFQSWVNFFLHRHTDT